MISRTVAAWALELPRSEQAPSIARHAIRDRYARALSEEELLRVVLLTSELVTNAVLHGTGAITLSSQLDHDGVRVEILDQGSGFEHRPGSSLLDRSDVHGLAIVNLLASRWGTRPDSTLVWFELDRLGVCRAGSGPSGCC